MFRGCQRDGAVGGPGTVDRLTVLGRPPRTYRAFAEATFGRWKAA